MVYGLEIGSSIFKHAVSSQATVAVVTGATGDIGSAICRTLGRAGAVVIVSSRRVERVSALVSELRGLGVDAYGVAADACSETDVTKLFEYVNNRFDSIDILVNGVGGSFSDMFKRGPVAELLSSDLLECFRLNVISAILCAQRAQPLMTNGGSIINLSSMSARAVSGEFAAYGASKAALECMTRYMASEFGPSIRVNAVSGGPIETVRSTANRSAGVLQDHFDRMVLRRLGLPVEMANAVLYFASSMSTWVTGTVLDVDGGYSL